MPPTPPPPVNGMSIYGDALVNGWNNWSWATVNTANTSPVHTGSSSIAVTADGNEALYLQHATLPTEAYSTLKFWINGGAIGGQTLKVVALRSDVQQPPVIIGPLAPDTWQEIAIPLASSASRTSPISPRSGCRSFRHHAADVLRRRRLAGVRAAALAS